MAYEALKLGLCNAANTVVDELCWGLCGSLCNAAQGEDYRSMGG